MSYKCLFSALRMNGKSLGDCAMASECSDGNYRLYIDMDVEQKRFSCMAVSFVCADLDDVWACPALEVELLFSVEGYFDGVRHMAFAADPSATSEDDGYMHYPDIFGILCLLNEVKSIESEICTS